MRMLSSKNLHKQQGFSILEPIITLVITAIGLLGVAGLINWGVKAQVESTNRTVAVNNLLNLSEFMHGISFGGINPAFASDLATYDAFDSNVCNGSNEGDPGGVTNALNCFYNGITSRLAGGNGFIQLQGNGYLANVYWQDNELLNRDGDCDDANFSSNIEELQWTTEFPDPQTCMASISWVITP